MNMKKNLEQKLYDLALKKTEYTQIIEKIGRVPNDLELGLFGSLWSEHCGYQHSKPLLKKFKFSNDTILVDAGSQNAGAVDIGNGLAAVFKIESHNHPSAVEPVQGAATGIGGIVRDILAMGARPVALMNSLRFGDMSLKNDIHIFNGVVAGISEYGNCIGIPNVGGEIVFDESYNNNPLVNAFCLGIVKQDEIVEAKVGDVDNILILAGSRTGKDGIHGASGLASQTLEEESTSKSTVQVGDPFIEKLLIEACLEVIKADGFVGLQDLGAAGLTSSVVEAAERSKKGVELNLDQIKLRDISMTPYEIMLSESQERMLVSCKPGNEKSIIKIFEKWDLEAYQIGKVINKPDINIYYKNKLVADLPIAPLVECPTYTLNPVKPKTIKSNVQFDFDIKHFENHVTEFISNNNLSSRNSVFRRYDHQVQNNTVIIPGHSSAGIRIKETGDILLLTTDGNSRYCSVDPYKGTLITVAESCRNISTLGGTPLAITNCLNFGNPENPEVYYQLDQATTALSEASKFFNAPVISGNVSLYNETNNGAIKPSPIISTLGILKNGTKITKSGFVNDNDIVYLLGIDNIELDIESLHGSEYENYFYKSVTGIPEIDLDKEKILQDTNRELINKELINSANDCSDGGLLVTLLEKCFLGGKGFEFTINLNNNNLIPTLFGEVNSRIVISISSNNEKKLLNHLDQSSLPYIKIGKVKSDDFIITQKFSLNLASMKDKWLNKLNHISN
jgi:phosphoribosylformylglycinamidine synthase